MNASQTAALLNKEQAKHGAGFYCNLGRFHEARVADDGQLEVSDFFNWRKVDAPMEFTNTHGTIICTLTKS